MKKLYWYKYIPLVSLNNKFLSTIELDFSTIEKLPPSRLNMKRKYFDHFNCTLSKCGKLHASCLKIYFNNEIISYSWFNCDWDTRMLWGIIDRKAKECQLGDTTILMNGHFIATLQTPLFTKYLKNDMTDQLCFMSDTGLILRTISASYFRESMKLEKKKDGFYIVYK